MTEYQRIKAELKEQHCSTKYFTKQFLENYKAAVILARKNFDRGIDDSYPYEHYHRFHSYDKIYADKFYIENSGAYCVFLEIVWANYRDKWLEEIKEEHVNYFVA